MAQFKVSVRPNNQPDRPHLKWVVTAFHPSKGRSRSFFETKTEAESEATAKRIEVENLGIQAMELDARLRIEALSAVERLRPFGSTLTEAVDYFISHKQV